MAMAKAGISGAPTAVGNPNAEEVAPSASDDRVAMLRDKLVGANLTVEAAAVELDRAVAELRPVGLGDKRMTSEAVGRSFDRLKNAHTIVQDLERLLAAALAEPPA
jgi:hypothetical protein